MSFLAASASGAARAAANASRFQATRGLASESAINPKSPSGNLYYSFFVTAASSAMFNHNLGFIGLGNMGKGMAKNLLDKV